LIGSDDVTGRTPAPGQRFAMRRIGGQGLSVGGPNADAKSQRPRVEREQNQVDAGNGRSCSGSKIAHDPARKTRLATVVWVVASNLSEASRSLTQGKLILINVRFGSI
jgi:hypothetical protein